MSTLMVTSPNPNPTPNQKQKRRKTLSARRRAAGYCHNPVPNPLPTLLTQRGSYCYLFSILNLLPDAQSRCSFLRSTDEKDVTYFTNWVNKNVEGCNIDHYGIRSEDIKPYLQHLVDEGVISKYTFNNCKIDFNQLLAKNNTMAGRAFILKGYTVSLDKLRTKAKMIMMGKYHLGKMIIPELPPAVPEEINANLKIGTKKEMDNEALYKKYSAYIYKEMMFDIVMDGKFGMKMKLPRAHKVANAETMTKKRKLNSDSTSDAGPHAVGIKCFSGGKVLLYDPGKHNVKLIDSYTRFVDELVANSLICCWTTVEFNVTFK
jgi:hypothetical protein